MRTRPHASTLVHLATGCLLLAGSAAAVPPRVSFVADPTASLEGLGEFTSLALDPLGRTHVAYFDPVQRALVYAVQVQGGWRREVVDAGGVGWYASLALDGHGAPRVAYYDFTHGALKYAERSGGAWAITVVDAGSPGTGHYCSLALAPNGAPAISYYVAGELCLRYAVRTGAAWSHETVDGAGNAGEAEAAQDRPDRGSKTPEISGDVPNVGLYSSLAIGRDGVPHISYQDVTGADLKVAVRRGGAWLTETVDASGDVGEHTSLKLDAAGRARVSYYDLQRGALKLAVEGADGSWTTQTVDAAGDVGAWSSLAIDADGRARVSYLDASRGALKYAEAAEGGAWVTQTLAATGPARGTSLALDRAGAPVIASSGAASRGSFRLFSGVVPSGGAAAGDRSVPAPGLALSAWPLPYKGGALDVSLTITSEGAFSDVRLVDLAGRHVRTLAHGALGAGRRLLSWDGLDDAGRKVANGVYFLVGRTGGEESRLKLVVLR